MRRSFETINYSLRPNKNVERKIIAKSLHRISSQFPIADYRYVGFGSMWFTDFTLFHRALGISDMVTIEKEVSRKKRVEFNKPYSCIEVRMGQASAVLGDLVEHKRSFVWLDYDGGIGSATSGDVEIAVGAMRSGSMIMLSVNASIKQLDVRAGDDDEPVGQIDQLIQLTGRTNIRSEEPRLSRNDFPSLVAEILHDRIKSAALSRPGLNYIPIWNFQYADGVEMISVGGMIVDEADELRLQKCDLSALDFITPDAPYLIKVPVLTEKEKRELDRRLPSGGPLVAHELPFELSEKEVEFYEKFYLDYPHFGELAA